MHGSCNDGVIQLSSLSFYAVLEVVEMQSCMFCTPCLVFRTHFSQLDLNPATLEATVEADLILPLSLLAKAAFFNDVTITSSLRNVMMT